MVVADQLKVESTMTNGWPGEKYGGVLLDRLQPK
jgi:hypothetical protein